MRFWQCLSQAERPAAVDPLEATSQDIAGFKLWMANTTDARTGRAYSDATQANPWRSVQTFYRWIVKVKRELPESPLANLRPSKIMGTSPPTLTLEQVRALVPSCRDYLHDFRDGRDRALLFLFYDCRPRLSEVANMTLADVDQSLAQITIVGKGRKQRTPTLGRAAKDALLSYLRRNRSRHVGRQEPWLWLSSSTRPDRSRSWRMTDSGIY